MTLAIHLYYYDDDDDDDDDERIRLLICRFLMGRIFLVKEQMLNCGI